MSPVRTIDPDAMCPFGRALLAYARGDRTACVVVRRDDGLETPLPASHFFRAEADLSPIETAALERCRGRVLDIGAGTGIHTLVLQRRGRSVTAIDVCADAVSIMEERGVTVARQADVMDFEGGPFDTLLMLGHGIGMVQDLEGLDRFLDHARRLVHPGGQLLLDSLDVRRTDDPRHLAYHEANRKAGRHVGETRLQFGFAGATGSMCGWLHVDPATLAEHAERAGWRSETLLDTAAGEYLARLVVR